MHREGTTVNRTVLPNVTTEQEKASQYAALSHGAQY